jgi:hypothetical protein
MRNLIQIKPAAAEIINTIFFASFQYIAGAVPNQEGFKLFNVY